MRQTLRFCMVTTFYPPYSFGGDAVYVHSLSNELARRGHHVEVIHCRDAFRFLAHGEPAGTYPNHPNVVIHGLESHWSGLSPVATHQTGHPLFKAGEIRRLLDNDFDVIHYHNISLVGGPGILAYGRAIKLYSAHDYWLICPTSVLFRYNRAACVEPQCLRCTLSHGRPPQWWRYTPMLQNAVKYVDTMLTGSQFSVDLHRARGLKVPMRRFPYFDALPPAGNAADAGQAVNHADRPYFLYVGRLERLKGPQTLVPVFQDYPKARLLVAGKGTFESELRRLANGSPNIEFVGHLGRPQLLALYRQAVAVIVPSINFEGAPLVVIEAFQHRTPVLARKIGALTEMLEESGGGWLYENEEQLVARLDQLLADPSLRERLGAAGYAAYQRDHTPDVHLERYFALIESLTARRRGHS